MRVCGLGFVNEKTYMKLVKDCKPDFIQEELLLWGFCSKEERLGSTRNTRTSGDS